MMEPNLPQKIIPKSLLILSFLTGFLLLVVYTWNTFINPSAEAVFYQTLQHNLRTKSLNLQTTVLVGIPNQEDLTIVEENLHFKFAPQTLADWHQRNLVYSQALAQYYVDPRRLAEYEALGIENLPQQEWYERRSLNFQDEVYIQHRYYTTPEIINWTAYFKPDLEILPWGNQWYHYDLAPLSPQLNLQLWLMTVMSTQGFLYGDIPAELRADLLTKLQAAYQVDFSNIDSYWQGGRLFYTYDLRLDYARFGEALVDYANIHIADETQKLQLTKAQAQALLQYQDIVYRVTIDTWSHQIRQIERQIEHRTQIPFVPSYTVLGEAEFVLTHQISPLVNNLVNQTDLDMKVVVKVAGYNQPLEIRPPPALELQTILDEVRHEEIINI